MCTEIGPPVWVSLACCNELNIYLCLVWVKHLLRRGVRGMRGVRAERAGDKQKPKLAFRRFEEKLAATYSRGSYTTTTIGKTEFDGRVRDGNGSDLSFMTTKKVYYAWLEHLETTIHGS